MIAALPRFDLSRYPRIVFFTGAGASAESGVPTYRGRDGIWSAYRWEDYACQDAFERDPHKVLDFHEQRRARVLDCEPHAGHRHLAMLQNARGGIALITQNTDGLLQRAGAREVIELHGSLWRLRCARHGSGEDLAAPAYCTRHCPQCGALLRPDITWFGDDVDTARFRRAAQLIEACELFVAVGCSAVVWPAAGLLESGCRRAALSVEINLEDTGLSPRFGQCLRAPASRVLPHSFPLPGDP
jgi:NAD-dependent deacetylase